MRLSDLERAKQLRDQLHTLLTTERRIKGKLAQSELHMVVDGTGANYDIPLDAEDAYAIVGRLAQQTREELVALGIQIDVHLLGDEPVEEAA